MATGMTHAYCTRTVCRHALKGNLCAFFDIKEGRRRRRRSSGHVGHRVPPACLPGSGWNLRHKHHRPILHSGYFKYTPTQTARSGLSLLQAWRHSTLNIPHTVRLEGQTCHTNAFCNASQRLLCCIPHRPQTEDGGGKQDTRLYPVLHKHGLVLSRSCTEGFNAFFSIKNSCPWR